MCVYVCVYIYIYYLVKKWQFIDEWERGGQSGQHKMVEKECKQEL